MNDEALPLFPFLPYPHLLFPCGQCCACSCVDGPYYACGETGFDCKDPACFDPTLIAEFPGCTGDWLKIGDGDCTAENNNALCGYDGGDCCLCSCSGASCLNSAFDCLDPSAGDEFFDCHTPPPAALPCSAHAQRMWVVETSAQAQALAAAVNCSGGSFEVEWRGNIVVDEPIYVIDGTVLGLTGAGSSAVMDGGGSTRLFTILNAALHLNGVNISSGSSTVGGAIAVAGSSFLALNGTNISGNKATWHGGGVYVSNGSSVSCVMSTFADNRAEVGGGAMYVTGGSVVSCESGFWFNNTAGVDGGALSVSGTSRVSWSDEVIFTYNTAGRDGGAVAALDRSSLLWTGSSLFISNSAGEYGGALLTIDGSNASWSGDVVFLNNSALLGGAICTHSASSITWSGSATSFIENFAEAGGAATSAAGSSLAWSESTTSFIGNSALSSGAVSVVDVSSVSWSGGK